MLTRQYMFPLNIIRADELDDASLPCIRPVRGAVGAQAVPSRVWMDASYSIDSGKSSGIERVVRNLVRHLDRMRFTSVESCVPVIEVDQQFYHVDELARRQFAPISSAQRELQSKLPRIYKSFFRWLCDRTGSRTLQKWFLPDAGHLGMFKIPHKLWQKRVRRGLAGRSLPVEFSPGDMLILPDAYWTHRDIWPAVKRAKESGAFIAFVVYDLIPITHSQFVGERGRVRFTDYFQQLARHADLIITISQTVCDQVRSYLPELMTGQDYCQDIRAFTLGAEFYDTTGAVRPQLEEIFGPNVRNNPYLTVSAFDPRKNHEYLLDAFSELWKTGAHEKLCLVGRVGARCERLIERIRQHPQWGTNLLTFHDLTDAELQYCYRHAKGVIFPSIVEGFGLPIVESLWHRQMTFASDTPIHREVGGDICRYFDLSNPISLVELLIDWDKSCETTKPHTICELPLTWTQSFDNFRDICMQAYRDWSYREPIPSTPVAERVLDNCPPNWRAA